MMDGARGRLRMHRVPRMQAERDAPLRCGCFCLQLFLGRLAASLVLCVRCVLGRLRILCIRRCAVCGRGRHDLDVVDAFEAVRVAVRIDELLPPARQIVDDDGLWLCAAVWEEV